MISKSVTGGRSSGGFGGLANYLFKEDVSEVLYAQGVRSENALMMAHDFEAHCKANSRSKAKPVWHSTLSFSPRDIMTKERMIEAGQLFAEKMNLSNSQYTIIAHYDKEHYSHIHIIANRINFDGNLVSDKHSALRGKAACREIEKELGLESFELTYRPNSKMSQALRQEQLEISFMINQKSPEIYHEENIASQISPLLFGSSKKHDEDDLVFKKKKKKPNRKVNMGRGM